MYCFLYYKYLDDIRKDPKIKCLLKYSRKIMQHHHEAVLSRLVSENEIEPVQILNRPKQFKQGQRRRRERRFYSHWVDTEEKRNSMLFVAGSLTAFAMYWLSVHRE